MNIHRGLFVLSAAVLTAGCHMLRPNCRGVEDYQAAQNAAPLQVPAGMDSPDVKGRLKIPPAAAVPPPGPKDACLEEPPKYHEAPRGVAAGG